MGHDADIDNARDEIVVASLQLAAGWRDQRPSVAPRGRRLPAGRSSKMARGWVAGTSGGAAAPWRPGCRSASAVSRGQRRPAAPTARSPRTRDEQVTAIQAPRSPCLERRQRSAGSSNVRPSPTLRTQRMARTPLLRSHKRDHPATARYRCQRSGTPLSSCSPRSSNVRPEPAVRSFTVECASTSTARRSPPPAPRGGHASPPMSLPPRVISPVCAPARIPNAEGPTASQMAWAHRTARAGSVEGRHDAVARAADPDAAVARDQRPGQRHALHELAPRAVAHLGGPLVEPTMSVNITVARTRSISRFLASRNPGTTRWTPNTSSGHPDRREVVPPPRASPNRAPGILDARCSPSSAPTPAARRGAWEPGSRTGRLRRRWSRTCGRTRRHHAGSPRTGGTWRSSAAPRDRRPSIGSRPRQHPIGTLHRAPDREQVLVAQVVPSIVPSRSRG